MDALTAFVDLVKALAWPATLFAIVWLLRKVIKALISSIHEGKIKYGDLELIVKRDLEQARQSIKTIQAQPEGLALRAPQESSKELEISDLVSLAQIAPRAAVIEAWTRLEAAGAEFVQKHGPSDLPGQRSPVTFGEVLRRHDLIPSEVKNAIQKLRDIRNRTVHSPEFQPSVEDAEEYVLLSMAVIEDLRRIRET
jgi:hypothetical protein